MSEDANKSITVITTEDDGSRPVTRRGTSTEHTQIPNSIESSDSAQKGNQKSPNSMARENSKIDSIQKKRASFLTDLRDKKKSKYIPNLPNSRKVEAFSEPNAVEISAESLRDPEWALKQEGIIDSADHGTKESFQEPRNHDSGNAVKRIQKNWLAESARLRGMELLERASESKQKKASVAMKYGW